MFTSSRLSLGDQAMPGKYLHTIIIYGILSMMLNCHLQMQLLIFLNEVKIKYLNALKNIEFSVQRKATI